MFSYIYLRFLLQRSHIETYTITFESMDKTRIKEELQLPAYRSCDPKYHIVVTNEIKTN